MREEIDKLMNLLPTEKKKNVVGFKILHMCNKSSAKEFFQLQWDKLEEGEKIQILFNVDGIDYEEISFASQNTIFVLIILLIIREKEGKFLPV